MLVIQGLVTTTDASRIEFKAFYKLPGKYLKLCVLFYSFISPRFTKVDRQVYIFVRYPP